MTAAVIVLGVVALAAIVATYGAVRAFEGFLCELEQRHANERHTLTSRIQAPALVPTSPAESGRPTPVPPKDVKEFASIGTVKHGGNDGD